MFVTIQKKQGTNQWEYPGNPNDFSNSFVDPENSQRLIVKNNSGKTVAELSALAGYVVVEYAGQVPIADTYIDPKDLVLLFPDDAFAELDDLSLDTLKAKSDRGKARKLLTIFSSSTPLNAASPVFLGLLNWALILDSFEQTDIDAIKNAIGI